MATLGQYNPKDYTLEQIALLAATHLHEQGAKSEAENPALPPHSGISKICMYNGPNGTTCGAGPFVQNYDVEMESSLFDSQFIAGDLDGKRTQMICEVQQIHDNSHIEDWEQRFYKMFSKMGYDVQPLNELYGNK